ncbi:MAG: hypothetical protein WDZ45_02915 [Flavobacteriaceae bacterium]
MKENKKETLLKEIGNRIQELRIKAGLEAEDISEMTGLAAPTIRSIEAGNEMHLSSFLAVCMAIGMHPKDVLDIEMKIKPFYELSNTRKEKTRLTTRIDTFIENNYFKEERTSRDIVNELAAVYDIKTTTSAVSVILKRKVEQGELKDIKKGIMKVYKRRW